MITDLEKFSLVIKHIRKLFDEHKAKYFFSTASSVELIITDQKEIENLAINLNIEKKELMYTIDMEIPAILSSVLSGESSILDFLIGPEKDKDKYNEKKQLINEKARIIEEQLTNQKMRDSYLLKSTSKLSFIGGLDWEVNIKSFDDGEGKIPNLKYAIIRLNINSPDKTGQMWPKFLMPFSSNEDNLSLSLDVNDIENLIDIFTDIRKALDKED